MTDLDPKLTFETFVVGPANRLASAAARRAADSPGVAYNPLYLYGPSGLGKSHILIAMAHQAGRRADGRPRVLYRAMEEFLEELTQAIAEGDRDGLRVRYRDLDILLLDDVQFIAGQPEAQEMVLRTLDSLTSAGRQIVLASDRPPADLDGLDERLLSRFAGGLIVDVAPPEFETRVAIVRRKSEERGQTLQPGVAEALARRPFQNVRELGGALNRVLAVQELEDRSVSEDDLPDLLGEFRSATESSDDALGTLLAEISGAMDVRQVEASWKREVRETVTAAEVDGFEARRLRGLLTAPQPPRDLDECIARFEHDIERLREIDADLDRLGNPWPEAAAMLLRDPDRLDEAEALLGSVRERVRVFPALAAGPDLAELSSHFPQLPVKAADQLVTGDKPRYTPLFLWSAEPAHARSLLAASARAFQGMNSDARIGVTSIVDFSQDFIRALSDGVAGAWRERWWTLDLLLVHGVEDLSETERAQDEFFHLFEALKRRGSRVLLVADRPPSRIDHIDDRLRSRFEGGLVLEAPARELPEGAGDVVFAADARGDRGESLWHELARDEAGDAPLPAPPNDPEPRNDPVVAGSGAAAPGATPAWRPSRERVIWVWPHLDDRLIEELD